MFRLLSVIILLFVFTTKSFAYFDIDKKKGAIISGKLTLDPKASVDLGEGEWTIFETEGWFVNAIQGKFISAYKLFEGTNEVMEYVEIYELSGLRKWTGYLMPWLESEFWKPDVNDSPDGCIKRNHYYIFEYIKKGMFYNCFISTIVDVERRLYGEDRKPYASRIRKAIREGDFTFPNILLKSEHMYFSFRDKDKLVTVTYVINPKYYNYQIKEKTRDTSEFHPNNINKHSKAKEIMNKWILRQKERHNHLEKSLGAKDKRFLFTEHKKKKPKNVSYTTSNSSKGGNEDVVDKLRKLNELYKSGALTKEEFDIAKKRILK